MVVRLALGDRDLFLDDLGLVRERFGVEHSVRGGADLFGDRYAFCPEE